MEREEVVAPKKARRQRKPRKKAETARMNEITESIAASPDSTIERAPVAAKAEPEPVKPPEPEPVAIASASLQQSMDAMVRQWSNIREISQSVTANFERVNALLQELPAKVVEMEKSFKQPPMKPAFLTKVASVASVIAIVFSLLSLSLSQSARQAVLTTDAMTTHPSSSSSLATLDAPRHSSVLVKKPREVQRAPKTKTHL
jgi:hypothetical protein